jgi:hypothetical protein
MDVENLDALNPTELDELLERALNPRVPVEVLYAVLDRIGPPKDGAPVLAPVLAPVPAAAAAPATADVEETTVLPPLATQLQAQVNQLPQPQPQPQPQPHPQPQQPTRGAATDRAVRPERPNQKQAAPQQKSPNPNPQTSKPGQQPPNPSQQQHPQPSKLGQGQPNSSQQQHPQTSKLGQQPPNPGQQQPKTATPAAHPARGAHAPTRRVASPPNQESGK